MSDPRPDKFRQSLKSGDLVIAHNYGSQKVHLMHLIKSKHELEKNDREYRENPNKRDTALTMWTGNALCSLSRSYYSKPSQDPGHVSDRCARCWGRWRKLGSPAIKGYEPGASADVRVEWPLPFGWREMPPAGHPYDVGESGDPASVVDKTGAIRGVQRTERRRWQRGNLVVRVAQYHGEGARGHGVLNHDVKKPLAEDGNGISYGPVEHCLRRAWEIMAKGGRP